MYHIFWLQKAAVVMVLLFAAGCATPNILPDKLESSKAPAPRSSGPDPRIVKALECIAEEKSLQGKGFAISVHADGTGKSASGHEGATGSFLPQGTTAMWVTQAVMYAGGTAQNYYELNTERALRSFGGDETNKLLSDRQRAQMPQFVLSTAFNALDFLGGPSMDVRVAGVGPRFEIGGVSLEVSAELYRPGDRMTLAFSSLSRQVMYSSVGIGISQFLGGGAGTLVTGGIGSSDQQRLQEATRDAVALSAADVLSRVPGVSKKCREMVEALMNPPEADSPQQIETRLASDRAVDASAASWPSADVTAASPRQKEVSDGLDQAVAGIHLREPPAIAGVVSPPQIGVSRGSSENDPRSGPVRPSSERPPDNNPTALCASEHQLFETDCGWATAATQRFAVPGKKGGLSESISKPAASGFEGGTVAVLTDSLPSQTPHVLAVAFEAATWSRR